MDSLSKIIDNADELQKILHLQDLAAASEDNNPFTDEEICNAFFNGNYQKLQDARDIMENTSETPFYRWDDDAYWNVRMDEAFDSPKEWISMFKGMSDVRVWCKIIISCKIMPKSTMLFAINGSPQIYAWQGNYGKLELATSAKTGRSTLFELHLVSGTARSAHHSEIITFF